VSSDAAKESWFAKKENRKTKLQGSAASSTKTLQSQSRLFAKNRFKANGLAVVH
jgi:hypothetical protein